MLRKFILLLSLLAVIITISLLAKPRNRDGHLRDKESKTKYH